MNDPDFQAQSHAKWILAGEHAVLRGSPALVFPVLNKYIRLSYTNSTDTLEADHHSQYGETLLILFWGALTYGFKLVDQPQSKMKGRFFLENSIPMGVGLGFSAALCVVIAKWFLWKGWIKSSELFEFSRQLEGAFHEKSSGVDVAGAMNDQGICYHLGDQVEKIAMKWQPPLYLSYSDRVSVTAKCIDIVKRLQKLDTKLVEQTDADMQKSVAQAKQALSMDKAQGLTLLADAINRANSCFERWQLVNGNLKKHLETLKAANALAVKPTGAGDGGYVLSLWEQPPDDEKLPFELIPAFE